MNSLVTTNIIRFFLLTFGQVLIFKRIAFNWGEFAFIHFIIYPLFIALLPIKMPRPLVMLVGFVMGLIIDLFYDSPGVHASACVFTAYLRQYIFDFLEPYEGYNVTDSPNIENLGIGWFLTYLSILLFVHVLIFFSIEAFSYVYFFEILLNTIFSFIASFIILLLILLIFKPKT